MAEAGGRVAAVVLAYSRLETLRELVAGLRAQTRPPDEIIVVNQGSRPELAAWLAAQAGLTVIPQENRGSAGGFCRGIEEALRRGHDWSWIFDDDAVPRPDALEALVRAPAFRAPDTVFLASRIVDAGGRTYMSPVAADANRWYPTVLEDGCVEATAACWLGLLVRSEAVRRCGLPIAEFFLWDEDLEFTTRLARHGRGWCAIRSVIAHYQDASFDPMGKDGTKFVHWARNRIARAKLEPGPVPRRAARALRQAAHFLWMVLEGAAPPRTVAWVFRGLFTFWPRIRFPEPGSPIEGTSNRGSA